MNDADNRPAVAGQVDRELGPVGWRYVPSDVWGNQVLTQDHKTAQLARDMGRDVQPLYTEAQMLERVAEERERWKRIAKNAQAVTTGGADKIDYFEVPSHLMAALAFALDEGPN